MSAAVGAPPQTSSGAAIDSAPGVHRPSRWRRWRWPVTVAAVVLIVFLGLALLQPATTRGDLDPDSAAPHGSRALVQLLRSHGVSVERDVKLADASAAPKDRTTILVIDSGLLSPDQLSDVQATGADLVLLQPDAITLQELAPMVSPAGIRTATTLEPGCGDADAKRAGPARAGGNVYTARVGGASSSTHVCYQQPPVAGELHAGSVVTLRIGGSRITALGQGDVLRNQYLAQDGNAALALALLGTNPALRWYRANPAEAGGAQLDGELFDLLPSWVGWVGGQLLIAILVVMIWRSRRLGRLVVEPLPVIVRSAEAQEGRARLYRQAKARDRAGATLRTAALRRLAVRLQVPPDADPEQVVELAATASGRSLSVVHDTLLGAAPRDDTALIALARRLDALERETI